MMFCVSPALTGAKLKAADLLFAGIATHYMPR